MKAILERLFQHQSLSREEARRVLTDISRDVYNPVQVASFATVYNLRPITTEELSGFRDALLDLCVPVDLEGRTTIDIVGTGGDGKHTFNISTTAAVVVAGAGYAVTKHGSYGVSSSVGSSNVLMALGYEFTNDRVVLLRQLDRANLCFFHAPLFHPALKSVVPIRKQLGMKTFFNMLGPLVNPAQPSHQLFGTFSLELARLYHYVLQNDEKRYTVVYALDGYDEIALTGPASIFDQRGHRTLTPEDFELPKVTPSDLYGGDTAEEAARIFLNVLNNEATPAQQAAVCANAGLAIHTLHPEKSLPECVSEARESIHSGRAFATLQALVRP